ncbi:S9 family peptidase [Streptomyces microflavus]|uniref:S9 family peptidase n=1 Tax=Streptomyces microflavus TaxID=1919 RepID=UPI00365B59C5
MKPPVAKRVACKGSQHDESSCDPYGWMGEEVGDELLAYLEQENAYARFRTDSQKAVRGEIYREIESRGSPTDLSAPLRLGDWWYYDRTEPGRRFPVHCRAPLASSARVSATGACGRESGEQVILDENDLARGEAHLTLGTLDVSPDGRLLAYSTDVTGEERFTLRIRDLATGRDLPYEIPDTFYGSAWSSDGSTLFYARADETWRSRWIRRHVVGISPDEDAVVHDEHDDRFHVGVHLMRSGRFVEIVAESRTTSEAWLIDAMAPLSPAVVVRGRSEGTAYSVEHWAHPTDASQDRLLVLHNAGGKRNFELATAFASRPNALQPVIPHRCNVLLDSVDVFESHVVVASRREGLTHLALHQMVDGILSPHGTPLGPEEATRTVEPEPNPEYRTDTYRFTCTSMVTPDTLFEHHVKSGRTAVLQRRAVRGGFDESAYEQRRIWATAGDGTRIPMTLVFRRGLPMNGHNPCVLHGYGAYGVSIDPAFSLARLSLLDRGFVCAVAHVRGGGELGHYWHEQGRLLAKSNSFTDFITCARYLVSEGWTSPDRLIGRGESAGGLLVAAAVNMAPDAFRGLVVNNPFVDVLTTMLDPTLPLTATEREEWGDPHACSKTYAYIKSYSPYENVARLPYPSILVTASQHDARVGVHEAARWVAQLRATATAGEFLLMTEQAGGHEGMSGHHDGWRDEAFRITWILHTLGIGP